jgi:hypothetical protein
MTPNEVATVARDLRACAAGAGVFILEGQLKAAQSPAIPEVYLEPDQALALISTTKPRVLYLFEQLFDLCEAVELAAEEIDDAEAAKPALLKAATGMQGHDGEICLVAGYFVVDSILHTVIVSADWFDAFSERVDQLSADATNAVESRRDAEAQAEAEKIQRFAQQLADHEAFSFGRVSAAKRLVLAKAMFAGEDEYRLQQAVERADQLLWLSQSGFKGPAE